jgi:hypothetical protein
MILQVARSLYIDQQHDAKSYLLETMWHGDSEALRYLDNRYQSQFGKRSILSGLIENRSRMYRRLYTIRAGSKSGMDDWIYEELSALDYGAELAFRKALASALGDYVSTPQSRVLIEEDEVLVDTPRRKVDSGGAVWIVGPDKTPELLSSASDPLRAIQKDYELLIKRARIFISPRVATMIGRARRDDERDDIQGLIRSAIDSVKARSQIQ